MTSAENLSKTAYSDLLCVRALVELSSKNDIDLEYKDYLKDLMFYHTSQAFEKTLKCVAISRDKNYNVKKFSHDVKKLALDLKSNKVIKVEDNEMRLLSFLSDCEAIPRYWDCDDTVSKNFTRRSSFEFNIQSVFAYVSRYYNNNRINSPKINFNLGVFKLVGGN